MEECDLDEKSQNNSLYITAAMPELFHTISQDVESEHSAVFEAGEVIVEENEGFEIDCEVNEKPESCFKRTWQEVNLADSVKEKPKEVKVEAREELKKSEIEEKVYVEEKMSETVCIRKAKLVSEGMFGISSYYLYEIVTVSEGQEFIVYRRFKDFEWLYGSLKRKFRGMSVPPLPSKTLFALQSPEVTERRRIQLEKGLQILKNHCALKSSSYLHCFLTLRDADFSKFKETERLPPMTYKYNDLEDALDQIISVIQAKMNQIFSLRILPFSKDLLEIDKYLISIQIPSYSLSSAYEMHKHASTKSHSALENMHFTAPNAFNRTMQLHKHLVNEFQEPSEWILNELRAEDIKIEGLRGAVEDYKALMKKYAELEALFERKSRKARTFEDADRYFNEISSIREQIATIEQDLETVETNVKNEKIWFCAERNEHLEGILIMIFNNSLKNSNKEESFWLEQRYVGN